ncbi:hypothetical protein SAMN05192558_12119 [Actinokineospora alba]|uniref:Molecular chaperone DnaJ n=1 Tax=Actinokineospora alba TaxID=504798 RepID=A0A1H0WFT0_9PSEU|nr:hypothetical protein [Actinokineospora alba]SDH59114.1 hypothetical protein SAMN05421871_101599 [Actinokineospora alba]SDP89592.1 hypothetical protein SAMN05192558_12119 [Actinokineospora alba]
MSRRIECPECLGSGLAPNRRDFCPRCGGIGQIPRLAGFSHTAIRR